MTSKQEDAGTRPYDHYAARLPRWRYILRQSILPLIRSETPPLALLQKWSRTPLLDSYFAFAANLGTHTFFMIFLPILFWCGHEEAGRSLVNLLAWGVVSSGIIKDLLCLPRPVSPPLQRITMSGSAALEYGFPSTHTTNAVSVALYLFYVLGSDQAAHLDDTTRLALQALCWLYAFSIAFGRLYCGMHGFTDVVAGGFLGAVITELHMKFGEPLYQWVVEGSLYRPFIVALLIIILVRTHPEPADNCPCFDDSVSFSGVMIGIYLATWRMAMPSALPRLVSPSELDHSYGVPFVSLKTLVRIPLGVLIIVAWRTITKPLMLAVLPPVFRIIEHLDLDLPRKYFLKASQYRTVPQLRRDDNVLPSASEMGRMFGDVRKRRGRAISVGPQSEADAYEVIAYNEQAKRRSRRNSMDSIQEREGHVPNEDGKLTVEAEWNGSPLAKSRSAPIQNIHLGDIDANTATQDVEKEKERQAIFSKLQRPRVRYDVEVVTKLVVYTGIAWWALEGCLVVFELIGAGSISS